MTPMDHYSAIVFFNENIKSFVEVDHREIQDI